MLKVVVTLFELSYDPSRPYYAASQPTDLLDFLNHFDDLTDAWRSLTE
jgi:hypothetical protein